MFKSWKVVAFTINLIVGLALSQVVALALDAHSYHACVEVIHVVTMCCLSFIMINVGYEFTVDKSNLIEYVWDYLIAMTAASFPWLFVGLWYILFFSDNMTWQEALLVARFSAPTSAGILFSMLEAAGLKDTWVFQRARILAIFDDLDTIVLMVPLKVFMVGFKFELIIVIAIIGGLLFLGWHWLHRLRLPYYWTYTLVYAVMITLCCKVIHYVTAHSHGRMEPIHLEVLLPAFVMGCIVDTPCAEMELVAQRANNEERKRATLERQLARSFSRDEDSAKPPKMGALATKNGDYPSQNKLPSLPEKVCPGEGGYQEKVDPLPPVAKKLAWVNDSTTPDVSCEDWLNTFSYILCDAEELGFPILYASAGFRILFEFSAQDCLGAQCGALVGVESIRSRDPDLRGVREPAGLGVEEASAALEFFHAEAEGAMRRLLEEGAASFTAVNQTRRGRLLPTAVVMRSLACRKLGRKHFVGLQADIGDAVELGALLRAAAAHCRDGGAKETLMATQRCRHMVKALELLERGDVISFLESKVQEVRAPPSQLSPDSRSRRSVSKESAKSNRSQATICTVCSNSTGALTRYGLPRINSKEKPGTASTSTSESGVSSHDAECSRHVDECIERWEHRAQTGISLIFMVLVGLSMPALFGHNASDDENGALRPGDFLLHVIVVSVLMILGKMFPICCYREEVGWQDRLALCLGMCPRGEVGASIIVIALELGVKGPAVIISMVALAINLVMSGGFIAAVKMLIRGSSANGAEFSGGDGDPVGEKTWNTGVKSLP